MLKMLEKQLFGKEKEEIGISGDSYIIQTTQTPVTKIGWDLLFKLKRKERWRAQKSFVSIRRI